MVIAVIIVMEKMNPRWNSFRRAAVAALCATAAPTLHAAEPLAVFECRERLERDWPRTLVTYHREFTAGVARHGELRLVDAAGREQPLQLWGVRKHSDGSIASARISFFAELAKRGEYRFELQRATPSQMTDGPLPRSERELLELDNGIVALRLPEAGEFKFDPPLAMGRDHAAMVAAYGGQVSKGIAPGPVQGVRLLDGRWVGGSYFLAVKPESAPKVTSYTCRVTEQGPLFVEATVRYTFTSGGWYQCTARVLAGDPAVRMDEQFDMGEPGPMWDHRVMFSLAGGWNEGGWKPDAAYWISAEERLKGRDERFQNVMRGAGLTNRADCGSTPVAYDEPFQKLFDVAARYPWNPNAQFFGLVRTSDVSRDALAAAQVPFLGVVPMHSGNWRGSTDPSDGMLFSHAAGDVCLNWRLRASPHPRNMLHTGEYDPGQPLTFCRRQWALIGGAFQPFENLWSFRAQEGHVTLDDYKDWILEWPADPNVTYPRLLFSRADVDRLRTHLDQFPAADKFRGFLYVNHTEERRRELWNKLTSDSEWNSPFGEARHLLSRGDPPNIPWAIGYRVSQMSGWAGDMDELLSSGQLTAAQRARLRSDIAALCHVMAEPDVNPRGSMTHLGNPNMPINRFCGLAWAAALIPDHPMAKTWLDIAAKYIRYKLAMNTAPNGTWGELISYYTASAPHLMQTASVLARAGKLDDSTARLAVMPAQFTLNLLTPRDPRFDARLIAGWGHEGLEQGIHFLVAANTVRDIDPQLATAFAWAWNAFGRPMTGHHDAGFSPRAQANAELIRGLPAGFAPPQLASSWLPGFGVTMRAHAGDPNETYLSFRQGYSVSHCDANQGDFALYAKGAPLVALSLVGYAIHGEGPFARMNREFGWHSRVRFGSQTNDGGWPGGGTRGGVPAHSFSDAVDYARAVGDYGPQTWTRQILFLKGRSAAGPNYFIFRDSASVRESGDRLEPKWWFLRTLGTTDQVQSSANELNFTSAFGPRLNARFLQPQRVEVQVRGASQRAQLYHVNASNWRRANPAAAPKAGEDWAVEDHITVSAAGPIPPGEDVLVALYPQTSHEPPPRCEPLADGVARIVTSEGTDYVFMHRTPTHFADGDVAFGGIAGAVRVSSNAVHLIISEGPGSISYRGTMLRSEGPASRVIPIAEIAQTRTFDLPIAWKLAETGLPDGCRVEGPARCELKIESDRLVGRSEGFGGFLHAPMPPGMKVLPTLVIDGQTYAPGTSGDTLIIPLLPGEHTFEVRPLEQPPVFRNWQAWEGP